MGKRKTLAQLESELAVLKARAKSLNERDAYRKLRDAHKNKRW